MKISPRLGAAIGGFVLFVGFVVVMIPRSYFEPPRREGPPAVVAQLGEQRIWLMVKIEEQRMIFGAGGGRLSNRSTHWETRYHLELHCHDAKTTLPLWKRHLLMLKDRDGGSSARARIMGPDGDAVWLFVNDQPLAVSSADGALLADRALLEERNPSLQGMIPRELDFFAFDGGLVITAADARRFVLRAPDFLATPYVPVSEQAFDRLQYMSTTWNGGYSTKDFLIRQATLGGRWIGLYTEKEATDAGEDEFGESLSSPSSVLDEGSRARRTFWTARIGQTKEFSEGRHDRLFDVTRVPGAPEYLESGLFVRQGTRAPLLVAGSEGPLVLHRTRVDDEGRLAFTLLEGGLQQRWQAVLPFSELENRWEWADRLLLVGSQQLTAKGVTGRHDFIVALDLSDGATRAWNVTLQQSVTADAVP